MHTDAMRTLLFTMKMSDVERRLADRIAAHHGLTVAGLIRFLLKKEEREIAAAAATAKPAKKGSR